MNFHALFEHLMEGVALHELVRDEAGTIVNYRILAVNPAFEVQTGIHAAKVRGRLGTEAYGTENPPYFEEYKKVALGGQNHIFETYFQPLNKYFKISVISPKADQFATLFEDITERKRAEEALRERETLFNMAFRFLPIGLGITTIQEGRVIAVNQFYTDTFGYTMEDLQGRTSLEHGVWVNPADRADIVSTIKQGRSVLSRQVQLRKKDATICWASFSAFRLPIGGTDCLLSVTEDITEQKRNIDALQYAQQFNSKILEGVGEGIIVYGPDLRYQKWNPFMEQFSGVQASDVLGRHPLDLFPFLEEQGVLKKLESILSLGTTISNDFPFTMPATGKTGWASDTSSPLFNAKGEITGVIGVVRDITKAKETEATLKENEFFFRESQRAGAVGSYRADFALGTWRSSEVLDAIFGMDACYPRTIQGWLDLVHPDDLEMMHRYLNDFVIGQRQPFDKEYRIVRPSDGATRWVYGRGIGVFNEDGQFLSLSGTIQDITARILAEDTKLRLQAQLQQSQKLESLGSLAGGVAHDINNVLGAILGLASAQSISQPNGSPLHQSLDTICKAAIRGGTMVKSLLGFARQTPAEELELNINELLNEELRLLERTTLAKITIAMDLDPHLRTIHGDASALSGAFMNLCVNAVDAMPEAGTLTLRTRNVDPGWIEVLVEDTGTGMPNEVLDKALDPFFTTKEIGKGTGLGLPLAFTTVTAHGGSFELQSQPGEGTRIRMRFPSFESKDIGFQPASPSISGSTIGACSVLLVDDDDLILKATRMMMEILGHTVTPATSGEEAISILEQGFKPDLVVLDLNMPGYGGKGTMPRLRALCPTTPVFLATGRADQEALDLVATYPYVTLLPKPFSIQELQGQIVHEVPRS